MKVGWFLAKDIQSHLFQRAFLLRRNLFELFPSHNSKNKGYKTTYLLTLYSTFNVVVLKKDIKKHVVVDQQT